MKTKLKTMEKELEPPKHLALIPDGNRRFAQENNISKNIAHQMGAQKMEDFLNWGFDLNIQNITVYAFSIDNFKRPKQEKKYLMKIYAEKLKEIAKHEKIHKNKVRLKIIGRTKKFPKKVKESIKKAEEITKKYSNYQLTAALGYGGRAEIVDATKKISKLIKNNQISPDEVDEELLDSMMYCPELPDPEIVIRTSGEKRISDFLIWYLQDTKLHFVKKYWPEFEKKDLIQTIKKWDAQQNSKKT